MRLSVVFELLLIFVLLAFAASRSVGISEEGGDCMCYYHQNYEYMCYSHGTHHLHDVYRESSTCSSERKGVRKRGIQQKKKNERQENPINKYCTCTDTLCNCCRDFQLPLVNLNGPGCASLMYLLGDRMAVSLSYGDRVITNQTLSGRKPKPVCMPLPGRISKFCGRVYNIGRDNEDFRACLGLELHSKKTVEAAVRVSCFRFGPRGVSAEGADPLPLATEQDEEDPEDDDDDDDDDYGIGDDDDDDEDDDEEDDDEEAESEEAAENDVDDTADYGGFSILSEDILGGLFGGSSGNKKPPKKKAAAAIATTSTTTTTTTTTRRPRPSRRTTTTRRPTSTRTRRPNRPWRRRTTTTTSTTTLPPPVVPDVTNAPVQANEVATTLSQTPGLIHIPGSNPTADNIGSNIIAHGTEISDDNGFQPVQLVSPTSKTQNAFVNPPPQSVTPIEDFGIQSSLADITGQLSASPITTIITSTKPIQEDSIMQVTEKLDNFEKVDTLQQAVTSSMAMDEITKTPLRSGHNVVKNPADEEKDEGGIEIVESFMDDDDEITMKQSVESASSESSQDVASDELNVSEIASESNSREKRVKKNKKKNQESDLDLGLSLISESLGLGGGGKRKKDKKPNNKVEQLTTNSNLKKNDDFDDILGLGSLSETLGFGGSNKNKNKQDKRKRENKMMKYDWEQYV